MTQIAGVFSFPLLEATQEDGEHTRLSEPEPETTHLRANRRRCPSPLTSEIKINGAAEGLFYVLE